LVPLGKAREAMKILEEGDRLLRILYAFSPPGVKRGYTPEGRIDRRIQIQVKIILRW
jgi:hypothetical protein